MIDREKLKQMYEEGLKLEVIGAEFGVTKQRVGQIAKRMGLKPRRKKNVEEVTWELGEESEE